MSLLFSYERLLKEYRECLNYIRLLYLSFRMLAGDVPRVDGQLAVARAFGDKSLKRHLSSEPDIIVEMIDVDTDFIILASDGLWKVSFFPEILSHLSLIFDFSLVVNIPSLSQYISHIVKVTRKRHYFIILMGGDYEDI